MTSTAKSGGPGKNHFYLATFIQPCALMNARQELAGIWVEEIRILCRQDQTTPTDLLSRVGLRDIPTFTGYRPRVLAAGGRFSLNSPLKLIPKPVFRFIAKAPWPLFVWVVARIPTHRFRRF